MEEKKLGVTGPKQRLHLFGFMDETGLLSTPTSDKFFGLGIVVLPKTKYLHDEIIKFRQRVGFHDEFKFKNVSRPNLPLYKQFVDLFFSTHNARFGAVMIDKSKTPLRSPKHTRAYNAFAGELVAKIIQPTTSTLTEYITILADDVSTSLSDKYEREMRLKVRRMLRRDALFGVCRVESHALSEIQLCDVILGAVAYSFKLRDGLLSSPKPAKVELVKYVQTKVGAHKLSEAFEKKCAMGIKFTVIEKA